ncbi:PREDICTED: serologically defined colon cancer antigen 3-like [Merops nubicus]|uniref:serologically defined colon cancer antigen 3-like n=1 Tax=Merops nubicus TaxID=57421 RepID=UPI0004F01D8D|nr:PREDICTED: serologically defined colon cancer antigen 3-like [Merops nubicus]
MPWHFSILGATGRVWPASQGLEDDEEDDDDEFSSSCHSIPTPTQSKSYDSSGDSQAEDLGESTPFSLNTQHSYMVKDKVKNGIYAKTLAKHALELEEEGQKFQELFYKGTETPGSLSEDEDHGWTYQLPVHQRPHVLQTGSYDSFQHSMGFQWGKHLGKDALAPSAHANNPYLGDQEHTRGAEPQMLHEEATGDTVFPSLQLTNDVLKEENAMLKRMVKSMQSSLENQACVRRRLEKQLKDNLAKEEKEAQKLQSFLQQTKWSLQLMTQRALEAESNVEKLKQDIFVLQGELERSKMENETLRASQTTDLGAVKHNIDFALQNLYKIVMGADWSIRQLSYGAQSLYFVAEVLKSTGKFSEFEAEQKP